MTVPTEVVVAVIAAFSALGALLLYAVRAVLTGRLLPRDAVPREDYDRQVAIGEAYAAKMTEGTEAVKALAITVERLAGKVDRLARSRGGSSSV